MVTLSHERYQCSEVDSARSDKHRGVRMVRRVSLFSGLLISILITCAPAVMAAPVMPQITAGPAPPTTSGMGDIIKPGTVLTYDVLLSRITIDQYGVQSQSHVAGFDWVIRVEEASGGNYAGTVEVVPRSGPVESQVYQWSYAEGQQNPGWYGPPLWVDPAMPAESTGTYGEGTWQLLGDPRGLKMPGIDGVEQSVNQMQTTGPGSLQYISYDTDYGTVLLYSEKTSMYFISFWFRSQDQGGGDLLGPFGGQFV